jgi:O-antigen chain-terminating methyltransferase
MATDTIEVQEVLESVAFMSKKAVEQRQNVLVIGDDVAPWYIHPKNGPRTTNAPSFEGRLLRNLEIINASYDVRAVRQIATPRKFMRSLVLKIKQLAYDEIRASLDPVLDKQVTFNVAVARCINELCDRIEQIPTAKIETRLVQLEHTFAAAKARTSEAEKTRQKDDRLASVNTHEAKLAEILRLPNDTFVKFAYEYLLGRSAKEEEVGEGVAYLLQGGDPSTYLKNMMQSEELWHKVILREDLRHVTERVVEVPWCLVRIRDAKRVLDVGCSESDYLDMLSQLELYGVDARPLLIQAPGMIFVQGDVTKQPFRSDFFDVVVCISTLEHIGAQAYGMQRTLPGADIQAMSELMRSTRPGGRVLVTVPYGRHEDHGWLRVYDESSWRRLIESQIVLDEEFYRYRDGRYEPCHPADLQDVGYILPESPLGRAGGIVCAELLRQ